MTPGHAAAARAPWAIPDGLRVAAVNGYPLAYREDGAGPPLVLIHGSLTDSRAWSLQVPAFAQRYRVFALNLRHYHPEPWDGRGDDFSVSQHAADVAAFIRHMDCGPMHVVGHSRGGAVALTLARRHRGLVRTLTLADPRGLESLLADTPAARDMATQLAASFARLHGNLAAGDVDRAAREFVDALAGPGAWARRPPELKQLFLDNLATAVDSGESPALDCSDVTALACPVLLITGERSPPRYGEMFAAMRACRAALAPPVTIADAAHGMQRDNPAAFNAAVLAFLAGND